MREVLNITHHGADAVPGMRNDLLAVHVDARAELLDQQFYSVERFWERLESFIKDVSFSMMAGHVGGTLVGYSFGSTLSADTGWWRGIQAVDDRAVTRESGSRTFAFREILVRKAFQHRGFAHQLHDALLAGRPEERATLLVRSDNPARALYLRWGWSLVGYLQPYPDGPRFESMVRPL